jgi:release factor glutamine methyltransferase
MTLADAPVTTQTMGELLATTSAALGSPQEARWIVAHAAGIDTGDLLARRDVAVEPATSNAVVALVTRRVAGEPLQYVLGTWAFRTIELSVDPRVLIPRPETEHVVTVALDELGARARQSRHLPGGAPLVAADLGTGSGAIALSIAKEFEPSISLEVWATDVSSEALEVFGQNLAAMTDHPDARARVHVAQGSWFDALPPELAGRLALVVANPPYVSESEWRSLDRAVRDHEPRVALVPGATGLEAVDVIVQQAREWLAPGGSLVVELAPDQARWAEARAVELGYGDAEIRDDLAGRHRILVARSRRA